jgi:hypothetical protein
MRTTRLILLILIIPSLTAQLVSCQSHTFAERSAGEMNLRSADIPDGWTLKAEVDSDDGDDKDDGLAAAIVGLV